MLVIEDLSVHYGRVPAVRSISLRVDAGEAVGLIGPNGAGKSTTLRTIVGLVRAKSGSIEFEGRSLLGCAPEDVLRRGMALVPAGRQVFGSLTVRENLVLGARAAASGQPVEDGIEEMVGWFPDLGKHMSDRAASLSGGKQQMVALARALLTRPRLLALDEPSLGLAPRIVDTVFAVLEELRTRGITVLLIEQNVARTVEFVDRYYVLRSGELVHEGTRDSHADDDLMATYMGI